MLLLEGIEPEMEAMTEKIGLGDRTRGRGDILNILTNEGRDGMTSP